MEFSSGANVTEGLGSLSTVANKVFLLMISEQNGSLACLKLIDKVGKKRSVPPLLNPFWL